MPLTNREVADFVHGFAEYAEKSKDPYIGIWEEVLGNYLLQDAADYGVSARTKYPLDRRPARGGNLGLAVDDTTNPTGRLRSPETHNAIESLLAKLMLTLFPSDERYVQAVRRGREDASEARTASDLLQYAFGQRNHYRTFYTALKTMLLCGTSIVQNGWQLIERPRTIRGIGIEAGLEIPESVRIERFPVYDDVRIRNVNVMDFLPDPGADNLEDMLGAGKYFTITASEARRRASRRMYDGEAVEQAIARAAADKAGKRRAARKNRQWQQHLNENDGVHFSDFDQLQGIEYWGEFPGTLPEDGERWRVLTLINGVVVRNRPWPLDDYRLPFYDFTMKPIEGRFWGMSPGESVRHQQDFLDFLLCMLADAIVRSVHPPILYNRDDEIDIAKLAEWSPDVPIASERPNDIKTLNYSGDKFSAFNIYNQVVNELRSTAGAEGIVQGKALENSRTSKFEAQAVFQSALDRPELAARYLETECLKPLGRSIILQYQQNLVSSEELARRIGERPEPVALADIMADFDIRFVGSRNYERKTQKLAMIDQAIRLMSLPQFSMWFDHTELGLQLFESMGLDELAETAGTPETVAKNVLMAQLQMNGAFSGNGNGQPVSAPGGDINQLTAGLENLGR